MVPSGKPATISLLKEQINKMIPDDIAVPVDQSITQPWSMKLFAIDENWYTYAQMDNVQRVRNLEHSALVGMSLSNPSLKDRGSMWKRSLIDCKIQTR